jgi:hypothetical protein
MGARTDSQLKALLAAALLEGKAELEDQITTAADGARDRIRKEIEACDTLLERLANLPEKAQA